MLCMPAERVLSIKYLPFVLADAATFTNSQVNLHCLDWLTILLIAFIIGYITVEVLRKRNKKGF